MTASKLLQKLFKRAANDSSEATTAEARDASPSRPLAITPRKAVQHLPPQLQQASLFLSLPGEIRNSIYSYVIFPSLSTITIIQHPERVFSLAVFHICRQIRIEAISHLCSTKKIFLSGLRTANEFFGAIQKGIVSVRHVMIQCEAAWWSGDEAMEGERIELLNYLRLATGLARCEIVVGALPFDSQDRFVVRDAQSGDSGFLYAVRSVVDGEVDEVQEERVTRERFLALCERMDALEAVRLLKAELSEVYEQRIEKVFRLCRVTNLKGEVEKMELPVRIPPECLMKTEEDSETAVHDRGDDNV